MRLATAISVLLACAGSAMADISIRQQNGCFETMGWKPGTEDPASVFSVYAGKADTPMLGGYESAPTGLRFCPRFPPAPGVPVRVVLNLTGSAPIVKTFESARPLSSPTAQVRQVYPTIDVLPENQLKFYIEFTHPMSRGEAWQHLRLLKADGTAVDLPFLEIDQELWDPQHTRLTVLFDPGRIKRGVLPLGEVGPALEVGHSYTLVVGVGWKDAHGASMKQEFRKTFRVGEADRVALDPQKWTIVSPASGTRGALTVKFGEALDYGLVNRLIEVKGNGVPIQGKIALADHEQTWSFEPDQPWPAGKYEVSVDSRLEDLAGNKVGRVFDVDTFDTFERVTRKIVPTTTSLPFVVSVDQK